MPFGHKITITGLDANGDGDKSQENAAFPDVQESDQTDMNTLTLDHSEYESLPENSETGKTVFCEFIFM